MADRTDERVPDEDSSGQSDTTSRQPDRPPLMTLLEAFGLRRNVKIGAVAGVTLAVAAYLFRVLELWGPFAGTRQYPILGIEGWFLLLAFVLAVTFGMLVAATLTVATAVGRLRRVSKE